MIRTKKFLLGTMLGALAVSPVYGQAFLLGSVQSPYPALQSQVTLAGTTWSKGSVSYGPSGTPLILTGTGLGSSGTVEFIGYKNGVPDAGYTAQALASSWSPTSISVMVPNGATSGLIKVTSEGRTSNGLPFIVTAGSYSGSCPVTPPSSELQITTAGLDDAAVGEAYSATLTATGGTQAYSWSNPDGSLPSGLTMSSAGVISGTPTQAVGTVNVTVQATDSSSPSQTTRAVLSLTVTASASPTVVYTYTVGGYDPAGNLLSYTDSVMGSWSMSGGYDTLNRLTAASATSGVYQGLNATWTVDSFGNRTSENFGGTLTSPNAPPIPASTSAGYNASNQVQTASGMAVPTYDSSGDGDVTNDGQNQYLYDGEGRVCAIKNMIGKMVEYLYDAEGTRVAKGTITSWSCNTASNGFQLTTSYILTPGNQQLTELAWSNGTAQWAHTNVWGAGQLIATYSADTDLTQNLPGILNFYVDDPLGTRRVMTDYAGNIQETCHSLPYGNGEDCAASPTEHLFTQKERDAETGNDYFGARYYASSMGRFLTPDWSAKVEPVPYSKLDDPQTLNLYAYVGDNPFIRLDADGHACKGSGGSTFACHAEALAKQWKKFKGDVRSLLNTAQLTGEAGIGFKGHVTVGGLDLHGGATIHIEKSAPLVLSHKSRDIIPNAEPTTIKAEIDGGVGKPVGVGGEAGLQDQKGEEGGNVITPYVKPDLSVGGDKGPEGSTDGDRVSIGVAAYWYAGGGGNLSVDTKALTTVLNDVSDAWKQATDSGSNTNSQQ